MNYLIKTSSVYRYFLIAIMCLVLLSCSPYNGEKEHDVAALVERLETYKYSKGYSDFKQELIDYGYSEEMATEICNEAFAIWASSYGL